MPYKNYIYEYYAKISSGEIIVGKWIKKIFEIIINGLQTQEYFFNAKAANKAIKFIETFCHHSKGRNDLITLELWQKAIVSTIFGIQDAEKIRVFREIFIVIGRKNGKSLFASALIAYMAYLEPEYGQEIYCLAPKLDQAALVYDGFYQMVQAEEELEELAKKRRSDIYIAESNTVIKPISYITQYYNNVIVAFNNSSKYVQINAGEIAIYDYGVSASKKRAVFDEQGNHFYRDNYYVGKIGTNQWVDNNAHKGLVFDLETQGKYMAWAQKPTEGASSYTTILCYSRANSIFTQVGLHLGCNMYGHGWILDNVDLRNCSANGYTTFTGTLPVVLEIHKTDNNGGIGWTYGNVYIKNGLITSIPQ